MTHINQADHNKQQASTQAQMLTGDLLAIQDLQLQDAAMAVATETCPRRVGHLPAHPEPGGIMILPGSGMSALALCGDAAGAGGPVVWQAGGKNVKSPSSGLRVQGTLPAQILRVGLGYTGIDGRT